MDVLDFDDFPRSNTYYGGSERKLGIVAGRSEYMLKFQKADPFGALRANHVCEYLGSHAFRLLGLEAQETLLGTYRGEEVVACKNFLGAGEQFVPFNDVGESSLERSKEEYQYSYTDIMRMLEENRKLTSVARTVSCFWEIYIVDALLGNFDRHGANWGFIKSHNAYRLAPVFDNGSCLFPSLTDDEQLRCILSSDDELDKRVYGFPTSQIKVQGRKSSYFETIDSLEFGACNDALIAVVERCDVDALLRLVKGAPFTSALRRDFLLAILERRYEGILLGPYRKLTGRS